MARIVLVEDNEMNRDMLSRLLIRKGYEVLIAVDGEQGVAMATQDLPYLIVMDVNLPQMNGCDATRAIKANPQTQHIPVITLTVHVTAGERENALAARFDGFDIKPVELPNLLAKMEAQLAKPT